MEPILLEEVGLCNHVCGTPWMHFVDEAAPVRGLAADESIGGDGHQQVAEGARELLHGSGAAGSTTMGRAVKLSGG